MKLRKIKWNNHPILGNLVLDLVNPENNTPYDSIILAGENGTGKTTILDTIYSFLSQGPITPFDYIEYQIGSEQYKAYPILHGPTDSCFKRENLQTNLIEDVYTGRSIHPELIKTDIKDPRHYGTAYTKARANYEPQPIHSVSTSMIDDDIYKERSETNATALKQLIVDIQTQDNNDFALLGKRSPNNPITWQQFDYNSKMHRFSSAFNNFFDHRLTYDRVSVSKGVHEVFFKKRNADICIDKLSTGESQIVYRGTYLLKNAAILDGSVIFIDEPEISMHPSWQQKVLSYYKGLFDNKAQLFIATHSQGVISDALKDTVNTKVIVLRCDINGIVTSGDISMPLVLNNNSSSEINYQAFDIASIDYHIALYSTIQNRYQKYGIKECDVFIKKTLQYDVNKHEKVWTNRKDNIQYETICSYVRNAIAHPDPSQPYNDEDLKTSINLMIDILRNNH